MANFTLADDPHGHVPVMRDRMAELLAPSVEKFGANAVLIDGTLGAGGHTEHFLNVFPEARVIGVDRDPNALRQASERLAPFAERFVAVQARFDHVDEAIDNGQGPIFDAARKHGIAGALFDLGVSSMQLDQEERGFSYRGDAPLDMRMDQTAGITAAELLKTQPAKLAPIVAPQGGGAILVGQLVWDDKDLGWATQWRMAWHGRDYKWQFRGVTFDEAFRRGIGGAAQVLSGNGDPGRSK